MKVPAPTAQTNWKTALLPIIESLEAERKRAQKTVTNAGLVIAGIAGATTLYLIATSTLFTPLLLLFPLITAAVIFGFVYSNATSTYREGFKSWVLPQLVAVCASEAGGTLAYSSGDGITKDDFRNSNLFRTPDRYSSEDLISGNIEATALRFSEVHAEYLQVQSNGKTTTFTYHTIFKGLFFIADFNKNFQGVTFVRPDTAEPLFGSFGQSLQQLGAQLSFGASELVRLEDPDFEQAFVVYSTDQVEARYILSPALMQRLLQFHKRCGTNIQLVFCGGNMIIAVPLGVGWLEPPSLGTPLTMDCLYACLDQLRFAVGIVSDMDLNTRIWSK